MGRPGAAPGVLPARTSSCPCGVLLPAKSSVLGSGSPRRCHPDTPTLPCCAPGPRAHGDPPSLRGGGSPEPPALPLPHFRQRSGEEVGRGGSRGFLSRAS